MKVIFLLSDVFFGEKNNEFYYNFLYYFYDKINCIFYRINVCIVDLIVSLRNKLCKVYIEYLIEFKYLLIFGERLLEIMRLFVVS